MKYTLLLLLLPLQLFAQSTPSPIKHSDDPTCHYQVAKAIVADAEKRFGKAYQILTPGLFIERYSQLESYPSVHLSRAVITLKRKSTGVKSEIYYGTRSKSVGLGSNGHPLHQCSVTVDSISLAKYEDLVPGARP